jgi:hypothetical protein
MINASDLSIFLTPSSIRLLLNSTKEWLATK